MSEKKRLLRLIEDAADDIQVAANFQKKRAAEIKANLKKLKRVQKTLEHA